MNRGLLVLLISMFIGILVFNFTALSLKEFKAGDIGLGIATTSHDAFLDTLQISQSHGNTDQIAQAYQQFQSDRNGIALWIGNSQLHAINFYQPNDHLAVEYANLKSISRNGQIRYLQLSSPNINYKEKLIYYLKARVSNLKINWLIIAATFRGFHFLSVRESFLNHLRNIELDSLTLNDTISKDLASQIDLNSEAQPDETPQDVAENKMVWTIEKIWPAYDYRGNVRSKLRILPGFWFQKFSTKNNFYDGADFSLKQNLLYLDELLGQCASDGVNVLIYKSPHPQSNEKFQYNQTQYKNTFKQIAHLAAKYQNVHFIDLESIVPLNYWGKSNRGWLDIFHFKDEGHQILGSHIDSYFKSIEME